MTPEEQNIFQTGKVLLVDKPLEWTSFDVVNKLRYGLKRTLNIKKIKVGHAGTLDPLATGLLVICTGKFTKKINTFQDEEKEYTGTILLGATTPSYDLETEVDGTFPTEHITEEMVRDTAKTFIGFMDQVPPLFSAKKVDGERAYHLARRGETKQLKPKHIEIKTFEITRCELPEVDFKIACSKGTYIRSIAYDFGKALDSGGHLKSLRRIRSGEFEINNALTIEQCLEEIERSVK